MTKLDDLSAEHMSWLVESRSRNQQSSLKLFLIMKDNAEKIRKKLEYQDVAQGLVAVSFSLWRAVFLSDIAPQMEATTAHAQAFFGKSNPTQYGCLSAG
jgi:hypothetical protein